MSDAGAGVAFSEVLDSRRAAAESTREALRRARLGRCDLVIAFAGNKHDPDAFLSGIREVVGDAVRVLGGSAGGIITNDRLGYDGGECGVAVLAAPDLRIDELVAGGIDQAPAAAGAWLGGRLHEPCSRPEAGLLLLYDAVKRPLERGLQLNYVTPLLAAMKEELGAFPNTAGIGVLAGPTFTAGFLLAEGRVRHQAISATVFSGGLTMSSTIFHGCRPSSGYRRITKADGPVILEIDGRPALDATSEFLGPALAWKDFPLFVTLGSNRGEKFGEFRELDYVNRLCLDIDQERRGLVMAEPDLTTGAEVQFMRRSIDLGYIAPRIGELLAGVRAKGRRPLFALYLDCLGRAARFAGVDYEEASEVQRMLGEIPLLGVYSGVELANVGQGEVAPLDWTGVLSIFSV
jgi:small ligand-binding sensory domain FIST